MVSNFRGFLFKISKKYFLNANHIWPTFSEKLFFVLSWNATETIVKGTVLVLVPQIEPNPTSCQYPLINCLDLNQHLSASVDTLAENPSLSLLFRHSTNTLSNDKCLPLGWFFFKVLKLSKVEIYSRMAGDLLSGFWDSSGIEYGFQKQNG